MIIYLVTNRINGKQYVGQTVGSLEKRKRGHINDALNNEKDNTYFHNAIRKHGPDNFTWEILHDNIDTIEELNKLEIYYIGLYNTFENGYNLTLGGGGMIGWVPTKETKRRISEGNKGKKLSKEHKRKISEAGKGEKNHNYNKCFSEETRKKISEAKKGKNHPMYGKHRSEETKRKISEGHKGKIVSNETRRKMSKNHADFNGRNNPSAKAVIINNNHYDTRKEAAECFGISPPTIRRRIQHKTKWQDYHYVI